MPGRDESEALAPRSALHPLGEIRTGSLSAGRAWRAAGSSAGDFTARQFAKRKADRLFASRRDQRRRAVSRRIRLVSTQPERRALPPAIPERGHDPVARIRKTSTEEKRSPNGGRAACRYEIVANHLASPARTSKSSSAQLVLADEAEPAAQLAEYVGVRARLADRVDHRAAESRFSGP